MRCRAYILLLLLTAAGSFANGQSAEPGLVKISFVNTVTGKPILLDSTVFTNPFSETYTITRFKYYISNLALTFPEGVFKELDSYHLVDQGNPQSLSFGFTALAGTYDGLVFLLGVDSLRNVSGAQSGALDPLNDMFWTWNTGYIMAKMEGRSPQSKLVNRKVEYHIGGFAGVHSVLKNIKLPFPVPVNVSAGKTTEIIIETDFAAWWQQPNELKISEHPVCSSPGELAKKIADNYSKMFRVRQIINP
ncbi:MAG TPA: hypothetical protein PLY26_02600 [Ferruginibacter sp.]|nr:hypothetical protein [Ferruginibacter sp.]